MCAVKSQLRSFGVFVGDNITLCLFTCYKIINYAQEQERLRLPRRTATIPRRSSAKCDPENVKCIVFCSTVLGSLAALLMRQASHHAALPLTGCLLHSSHTILAAGLIPGAVLFTSQSLLSPRPPQTHATAGCTRGVVRCPQSVKVGGQPGSLDRKSKVLAENGPKRHHRTVLVQV